jgi:hypothetical protein
MTCSDIQLLSASYNSGDVFDSRFELYCSCQNSRWWLSQANHIFSRLGIKSNFNDYGTASRALTRIDLIFPVTL